MARKAYSDEERAQVKEVLMVTAIQCIVNRGLIHDYDFFRPVIRVQTSGWRMGSPGDER